MNYKFAKIEHRDINEGCALYFVIYDEKCIAGCYINSKGDTGMYMDTDEERHPGHNNEEILMFFKDYLSVKEQTSKENL